MAAYVYILKHKDLPLVKIGKAVNVEKRIQQIGADIDYEASYVKLFDSERQALLHERTLHKKLKKYRLEKPAMVPIDGSTEWFNQCVVDLTDVLTGFCVYEPEYLPSFKRDVQPVRAGLCHCWEYGILSLLKKYGGGIEVSYGGESLLVDGKFAKVLCDDLMKLTVKPSENCCYAVFTSLTTYIEDGVCEICPAADFWYSVMCIVAHFTQNIDRVKEKADTC